MNSSWEVNYISNLNFKCRNLLNSLKNATKISMLMNFPEPPFKKAHCIIC